jgi:hypothetical protein
MSQTGFQKQPGALLSVLGEIMEFKVTGEETAGSFCVIELNAFPHNGPPPHIHHRKEGYDERCNEETRCVQLV